MPRSLFLINVILFTVIAFLGFKLYNTWKYPPEVTVTSAEVKSEPKKMRPRTGEERVLNESSYRIIVEQDLFRPSRTPVKEETQKVAPLSPKERPILFGTMIMPDQKFAILEDPSTKTSKIYFLNDSFSGFTVSDILEDKVVLTRGDESIEIKLRDKKDIKPPKLPRKEPQKRPTPRRTRPRRTPAASRDTAQGGKVQ